MTDEPPPFPRPLRKWQRWLLWGWVFFPVIAFVGVARAFTFDWMAPTASRYVETVVRAHLARMLPNPGHFGSKQTLPMTKSYAGCRRWLPQELWQDCIALGLTEELVAIVGIESIQTALVDSCPLIDWLEGFRGVPNEILQEKYRGLGIGSWDSSAESVADMREYFHCNGRRWRTEKITIYALSNTAPFRTKLTELTFQH